MQPVEGGGNLPVTGKV